MEILLNAGTLRENRVGRVRRNYPLSVITMHQYNLPQSSVLSLPIVGSIGSTLRTEIQTGGDGGVAVPISLLE